jgi:hypothetical protein
MVEAVDRLRLPKVVFQMDCFWNRFGRGLFFCFVDFFVE